jgi:hypothetical protein
MTELHSGPSLASSLLLFALIGGCAGAGVRSSSDAGQMHADAGTALDAATDGNYEGDAGTGPDDSDEDANDANRGNDAGEGDGGLDAGAPPTEPLSTCILGWWQDLSVACSCTGAPECSAPDCLDVRLYGYLDGGVYWLLRVAVSPSFGTMSSYPLPGTNIEGQYSLADGGQINITAPPASTVITVTCEPNVLTQSGWYTYARPSPGLVSSVEAALANGSPPWTSVSFAP